MLTDKQINLLAQPLIETYSKVEIELLQWIAKKFSAYKHVGGDLEWKLTQLAKMGGLDQEAIQIIAQLNDLPFENVKSAIERAGIQSIDFKTYQKAYDLGATNVNAQNISFSDVIQSVYGEVSGEMRLMHQEISNQTLRAYNQVLDQINLETVTGVYDYNTSLNRSLSKLADKGITAQTYYRRKVDPDGNEILIPVDYSIEAAVRRTIVSAITRSANAHNEKVGKELGGIHWGTSQHLGARNKGKGHVNHESWQGEWLKEEEFILTTGEGQVDGLGGANCRHIKLRVFPGISVKMPPINTEENAKLYELEQKQRYLERQVRSAKKELEMAKITEDEDFIKKSRKKVRNRQAKVMKWVDDHKELSRDYNREKIQTREQT